MKQMIERYFRVLSVAFQGLYRWVFRTPDRAVDKAYCAAREIDVIVERYVLRDRPSSQAAGRRTVNFYIQQQLQRRLKSINLRLLEFRASAAVLPIEEGRFLNRHTVVKAPQGAFCTPTNLHKLTAIDEIRTKYSRLASWTTSEESTVDTSVAHSQLQSSSPASPSIATEVAVTSSPDLSVKVAQVQHMHEVTLLLRQLVENETELAKEVIGHLYDVATVNLIDRNVNVGFLNKSAKAVARFAKPVAKPLGYVWLQRNCPELIANWLNDLVSFEPQVSEDPEPVVEQSKLVQREVNEIEQDSCTTDASAAIGSATVEMPRTESQRLNQEPRKQWLTGAAAGATAAIAGAVLWLGGISLPPASEQVVDTTFETIEEPVEKKVASEGSLPSQAI
ncbi:MAG: hypothetical protein AB4050_06150 [Synechococcus sp.]